MLKEFKDMTPREVAQIVDFKEVQRSLQYYFPDSKWNGMNKVLERIKNAPKKKQKDPNERVEIYAFTSEWEGIKELDYGHGIHTIILGTDIGDDFDPKTVTGKPKSWSMSFRPWNELANIKFADNTFDHYTLYEMMAIFLWEITWYGSEKEMEKTGKELFAKVKEITKDIKKKEGQKSIKTKK